MTAAEEVAGEVVVYEPPAAVTLFGSDDPDMVLANAVRISDALARVVRDPKRKLISNIQGREFPLVECWTLLGTFVGVFPVCIWSRPMESLDANGEVVHGWEARVEAHTRDGAVVGAAEAQCTRAEKNWRGRDDYALRSMAQTRATSKALRLPLGFVMTLAGLEATPAEEMPDEGASGSSSAPRTRTQAQDAPAPALASAEALIAFQAEVEAAGKDWPAVKHKLQEMPVTEERLELYRARLRDALVNEAAELEPLPF